MSDNSTILPSRYSFRLVRRAKVGLPPVLIPASAVLASATASATEPASAIVRTERPKKARAVKEASIDTDKRGFLKLAGLAGLGLVAATALPQKAQAYVMGSSPTSGVVGVKNAANARIDPATESGNLASIKTNTDPLVASGAGGYVRQDSTATIAKETGGNLATIAGKDFATEATLTAIKTQTDKFTFSGSNLLTAGGSGGGATTLEDTKGTQINPATDDAAAYLRRMVKVMESQATVDAANRQRITVDSLGALGATMPVSGTVTATVTGATLAAGAAVIGSISNLATIAGQNQQMFQDVARNAYANGMRQNLIFS